MGKTVKRIVDEFKNRESKNTFDLIRFASGGRFEGYTNITNLYRDGVKVESLLLDDAPHNYEFDSGFNDHVWDKEHPLKWTHRTLRGTIVEFTQDIEE